MKKLLLKNLSISLYGLLILQLSVYQNKIFAKDLNKNRIKEISINYDQLGSNNFDYDFKISNISFISKNELVNNLRANGRKLFDLLAFEKNNLKKNFFLDINSDLQYKEKEVLHAEGNAIINFSNASLRGDLIKYDLQNKVLKVVGNVIFEKGEQYFEASKLYFDLKQDTGYIDDIYGVLDNKTFSNDFKIEIDKNNRKLIDQNYQFNQPKKSSSGVIGLDNHFENSNTSNFNSLDLKRSQISKLRYKSEKLTYNSGTLEAKEIFFTNDIYNEPQFVFLSKNFSAQIVDDQLRLLSRNSWITFDNKLTIPIGRRSIFEGDSFIKWGVSADYKDKDGYYLSRRFYPRKLFNGYSFQLTPLFLIQRSLKGSTNSFVEKNSSVFSERVESDIKVSDYFALDLNINREKNDWVFDSNIQLNSFNTERIGESLRTKTVLSKRINLKEKFKEKKVLLNDNDLSNFISIEESMDRSAIFDDQIDFKGMQLNSEDGKKVSTNFLDLSFYNIFREQIIKDFGTEDIYFASGINISNKKSWSINDKNSTLDFIYDVGHYKSESISGEEFKDLFRNSFVADYYYEFPLWKKRSLDKTIDKSYKFSPVVIPQSLNWSTGFQSALFLYSDASSQSALKFNTGPILTYGAFKEEFFDYTRFSAQYSYVLKQGESPFIFDNINDDPRIKFNLQQQVYGPLLFSYNTILNLNNGTYSNVEYSLDFKRRAYSIGAFYNSSNESLGIKFNIYNFDYSGLNKKF